ncbi:sensor histidine kinase [Lacticaseibacillus baoqingensis]|uniref:histidine kinase n=1 Tax=Lacticaseibacillus baoqingensis TaxID=2486013 RepID=A0ABW4E3F2_9LACO|nr:HAMP domain-containing sensor histidine kinase [Lacticaseibacillus baoqingensis]
MKNDPAIESQRRRLFTSQLLAFAGLFIALGLIVYFIYDRTVYHDVDQTLVEKKTHLYNDKQPLNNGNPLRSGKPQTNDPTPFRTMVVVFNNQGKISNKARIGQDAYAYLQYLRLNKADLNQKRTLTTASGTFRTLLIKIPKAAKNASHAGHFVMIVQNIDSQMFALQTFRQALILTMVVFWLLSLALSYWLANRSLQPVVVAWQHQQDFVANAAHELRAPLAVIQSQQEALLTKPNAKIIDQTEAIATSLAETKRLRQLTGDLLTIAKADSNAQELDIQPHDLKAYFTKVLQPYADIAASQAKHFTSDLPADGNALFDGERLHQLMVLLLDNAFKYTAQGDAVWVKVSVTNNDWSLSVGNSGPTITPADKAHIFERFYRSDPSRNRQTGGSGLGLAIGQWIVLAHHGKLTVQDVQPHGAVFTAKFPRIPKLG